MPDWKKRYPGVEGLNVAVMGCIVNGPGESKHADIGISLPGTGESPAAPVFIDGKKAVTLRGPTVAADFIRAAEIGWHCVSPPPPYIFRHDPLRPGPLGPPAFRARDHPARPPQ